MEACDKLKDARTHLRQAARSMLQAGIAAIDERDQPRAGEAPKP